MKKHGTGLISTTKACALEITSTQGGKLMEIDFDGNLTLHGTPSRPARALIASVKSILDLDAIGNTAADRIYRRALQRSLRLARSMTREEFIDHLEQELQARLSKAMLRELRRPDDGD